MTRQYSMQQTRYRVIVRSNLQVTHDSTFDSHDQAMAYYHSLQVPGRIIFQIRPAGESRYQELDHRYSTES